MTRTLRACLALLCLLAALPALAHGVGAQDAAALGASTGARPWVFGYLGAKHMVTGVDHLLFLLCVVFLLQGVRDVALYATLFAAGHSLTLVAGVLLGWRADEHLVDAVIGLSIAYKALDNLGAFNTLFGCRPPPRLSVALFGMVHGLGLAGRLQALALSEEGMLANLLAFNAGVEAGQVLALGVIAAAGRVAQRGSPAALRAGDPPGFVFGRAVAVPGAAQRVRVLGMTARTRLALQLLASALVSGLLLVCFVWPAEFHRDPTGFGRRSGLLALSTPRASAPAYESGWRSDTIDVPLKFAQELEFKVAMRRGATLVYSWQLLGKPEDRVYFEFHGETSPPAAQQVQSYLKQETASASQGALVAPFEGIHGWYFMNDSDGPVTVRLHLAGFYDLLPARTAPAPAT